VGPVAPELFHLFETAVRGGTCLAFRYRDRDGRRTLREVEPHGLAITPPVWYLLGRDVDSGLPRMFRMDRIAEPASRPRLSFRADRKLVEALLPSEVSWEPLLGFTRPAAS
jgi:predicted DNA-binding transcriptional regulator YafY